MIGAAVPLLICLLGARPVHAAQAGDSANELAEMPFEQLLGMQIYSASKFSQKMSEAPTVASVITADEIKAFGWRTLAEALNSIRGLYTTNDRNYQYLGARGFLRPGDYSTRFLLLVDGYRVNDSVYDQAPIGTDFILDVELIDRIEYIPGPGSSVYGSNAFFGVINVISKPGKDVLGTRASVQVGSYGERRARASVGWETEGKARFLVAVSDARSKGRDLYYPEFDTPDTNNGIASNLDFLRSRNLLVKGELGGLTLMAMHAERTKGIPTASFGQLFNDPRSRTMDTQTALRLDYQLAMNDRNSLSLQAFAGRHDYAGDYVYDFPPVTVSSDGSRAHWWGGEAKLVSTVFAGHKLVAGVEYQRDIHRDQYAYDVDPYLLRLDDRRSGTRLGLYLQDEITLRDDLLLNAGLRHDRFSSVGTNLSPRLALIYKASAATTAKAIFGTAFRAPNAYESYYEVEVGGQAGNADLKPEKIRSTELALEHQFSSDSRGTVSLFRNDVTNLISQTTGAAGTLIFRNIDQVTAQGIEFEYEKIWAGDTRLRGSYSWQQSRDKRTGLTPVNSPRHLVKLNLSMRPSRSLRAGLEAQYTSARATFAGATGSAMVANGTLRYALGNNAELSASVYNLLDRRYADPGSGAHLQDSIEQRGRTFRLGLAYRF